MVQFVRLASPLIYFCPVKQTVLLLFLLHPKRSMYRCTAQHWKNNSDYLYSPIPFQLTEYPIFQTRKKVQQTSRLVSPSPFLPSLPPHIYTDVCVCARVYIYKTRASEGEHVPRKTVCKHTTHSRYNYFYPSVFRHGQGFAWSNHFLACSTRDDSPAALIHARCFSTSRLEIVYSRRRRCCCCCCCFDLVTIRSDRLSFRRNSWFRGCVQTERAAGMESFVARGRAGRATRRRSSQHGGHVSR